MTKIKKIINTRAFLVVFSILASIALWSFVAYSEDLDVNVDVKNIKVQFIGAEQLAEESLVVTWRSTDTISFTFTGKRNVVTKLNNSNVTVTVDMTAQEGITAGRNQLEYVIHYPSGIDESEISVADASVNYITVAFDRLVTTTIDVKLAFNGGVEDGYQIESMECDPEEITISGPEAEVSQVDHAVVTATKKDISASLEQEVLITLVDANGAEVEYNNITLSQDSAIAKITVVMLKEVPLSVSFAYGSSATADNVSYEISPATIEISGEKSVLEDFNYVDLGTIDLTSFSAAHEDTFTIVIPNGTKNLTGTTTATVSVKIIGTETNTVYATNISYRNAPEGANNVTVITQVLPILLRSTSGEILDDIDETNVRVVADLSELGNEPGTFNVNVKVYVDGYTNVDVILRDYRDYQITVRIE